MDKSNSNSQQSNLFIISSQSSRSEGRKAKKENYIKFARRVQELLEVDDSDLDQLYQKVENIIKKYFDEHRTVEFREMYDYIVSLKANSKKMTDIVSILEKRLINSEQKPIQLKNNRRSFKGEEFETTSTSQKETKNSLHRQEYSISNKQSLLDHQNCFDDNYPEVNTSVKYNHVYKPTMLKEREGSQHELTPKIQRSNHSEHSPSKHSPFKHSPSSKLSFSGEEYQNRNKEYEFKVKEMMKQLQQIKQKISTSHRTGSSQSLRIDLKQNQQKSEAKQKPQFSQSAKQLNDRISQAQKFSSFELNPQEENKSSNISSSNSYINQLTSMPLKLKEKDPISSRAREETGQPRTVKGSRNPSILSIMKNTESITKQIQELKEVASRLEIDSNSSKNQEWQQSQAQIYPPEKINQLIKKVSESKSKKQPLLEEIENTTSQLQISEDIIPSFKNLSAHNIFMKQGEVSTQGLNAKPKENQVIPTFHLPNQPPQVGHLTSSQVITSFYPQAEQNNQYNLSTIKYVYNPFPQSMVYPNQANPNLFAKPQSYRVVPVLQPGNAVPIQRIYIQNKDKGMKTPQQTIHQLNPSQVNSPTASNYSSTSIMHPHLFHRQAVPQRSQSEINRAPYLNPQMKSPFINAIESYPLANKSLASSKSNNSSSNSLQRKGLNVMTTQKRL